MRSVAAPGLASLASAAARPLRCKRASGARPRRRGNTRCVAEPEVAPWQPDGTPPPVWDPEGLLPAPPSGGHFARRKEGVTPVAQPAVPAAAAPAAAATPLRSALLARPSSGARAALPSTTPLPLPLPLPSAAPPSSGAGDGGGGSGLGDLIEAAFQETFWGERSAPRVLDSFRRLRRGEEHVQLWPGLGLQRAESYVAGLSAHPFPDPHSGAYRWLEAVQRQAAVIQQEFAEVNANAEALKAKGSNVWVPAARKEAVAYGPNWRTLVLQDRGEWDEANVRLFPRTHKLIADLNAPTLEVFFARQEGGTGIKSHTDGANFIQTSHLGLDVPEGRCWIKVGEHTREWKNGEVIVCDTSFMHETHNDADADRFVLILRHWHPELTPLERTATSFLFHCLDDPTPAGVKAAQRGAEKLLKKDAGGAAKGKGKGGKRAGGGGGGFGAR